MRNKYRETESESEWEGWETGTVEKEKGFRDGKAVWKCASLSLAKKENLYDTKCIEQLRVKEDHG